MRARQHALPPVPGLPGLPDFAAVGSVSLEKKHKPARGPTVCNVHNSIAHKPLRTKSLKKSFYGTTFALIAHRPVLALLHTAKGAGREEAGIAQGNPRHGGLSLNPEPSAPEQHCVLGSEWPPCLQCFRPEPERPRFRRPNRSRVKLPDAGLFFALGSGLRRWPRAILVHYLHRIMAKFTLLQHGICTNP